MSTEQTPQTNAEDFLSTRDLNFAATLMTLKFPLLGIDYQIEGTKSRAIGYFKFTRTPSLEEAKRKYMQAVIMVVPQAYDQAKEMLKAEVMNVKMNPHSGI